MFTLFRCFTAGCSAYDGTPLELHLFKSYGARYLFGHMFIFLFVSVGIFNLIMAVFIDNVMDQSVQRKQAERGLNRDIMEVKLKELVDRLARNQTSGERPTYARSLWDMMCYQFRKRFLSKAVLRRQVAFRASVSEAA